MYGPKSRAGKPTLVHTENTNPQRSVVHNSVQTLSKCTGFFMIEHSCCVLTCRIRCALDVNTSFERLGNKATASK